ncbi:MAG: N-acetylmuramic acid 6-phosphate etherase [Clostridia bacterium]|nr:N-acetylmuramic acid 6-phosphate etherase [Clostridia bacterium]
MLKTEMRNPKTTHIDKMDTLAMLKVINEENMNSVLAVERELENIAVTVDKATECLKRGGRIIYIGAGTSGRIGVMDASECPPTYGVSYDTVIGIIAGGEKCLTRAGEGGEDVAEAGVDDLKARNVCEKDFVVGISVAGGAQYVLCAVRYAKSVGAVTVGLTSNSESELAKITDIVICPDTGAEVITGSTRMKGGNAQKFVLNMISTGAMVKCGYVYENLMVNLKPTNVKLKNRMISIVSEIVGCDAGHARKLLENNDWDIKKAVKNSDNL